MKTVRFGGTGLKVSEICLGTMTFGNQADEATAFAIMDRAFAAGVFFFDTADVYPLGATAAQAGATETIISNWLRERGRRGVALGHQRHAAPAGLECARDPRQRESAVGPRCYSARDIVLCACTG